MKVDTRRAITHKTSDRPPQKVAYRMSRDQRVADSWSILFAQELASKFGCQLEVVFTLTPSYPGANLRHFDFMLGGLQEVEQQLSEYNIPFILLVDENPTAAFERHVTETGVGIVVSDFDPLRLKQEWIAAINRIEGISHYEVDAHNIVPCHWVSQKVEYGAYTIRPKIKRVIEEFLTEFPPLVKQASHQPSGKPTDWPAVRARLKVDQSVPPVEWVKPGESYARRALNAFIEQKLDGYNLKRNNPTLDWQSDLSPYLHFGQLSAQRIAIEVSRRAAASPDSDAFLEELIVRRELSDNFCYFNPHYDTVEGFPDWVKKDIALHRTDEREYTYTLDELQQGLTHDRLWNAAQTEMVVRGKMHGYLRMYWAKKILEWTTSPEEALATTIYLNDRYSIDGRDPNGYAGAAWSIGGVHDRAWFPRPIFGKVRYMSYNGCKSKFDIEGYIRKVELLQSR